MAWPGIQRHPRIFCVLVLRHYSFFASRGSKSPLSNKNDFKVRERATVNKANVGTVSKATWGKFCETGRVQHGHCHSRVRRCRPELNWTKLINIGRKTYITQYVDIGDLKCEEILVHAIICTRRSDKRSEESAQFLTLRNRKCNELHSASTLVVGRGGWTQSCFQWSTLRSALWPLGTDPKLKGTESQFSKVFLLFFL